MFFIADLHWSVRQTRFIFGDFLSILQARALGFRLPY